MTLKDALFNWLQIKLVAEARPDDRAARDTLDFFEEILREDHQLAGFRIAEKNDTSILVEYETGGQVKQIPFDRELAGQLLDGIRLNPKYGD